MDEPQRPSMIPGFHAWRDIAHGIDMANVTVIYGEKERTLNADPGAVLGDVIALTDLPIEQPCAGRGTCGKCKVLVEQGLEAPDEIEREHLTSGELALNNRLACRARIAGEVRVILTPIVVYSNKIFHGSNRYRSTDEALGLAIDLGSTTVAAFLTILGDGEVCRGAAGLNQQTVYGADVISRLKAALEDPQAARRLQRLALASINQAVDALNLSGKVMGRVKRVTIVGNVAMHHLLAGLPIGSLARLPFQPFSRESIRDAEGLMGGIFEAEVAVSLPPLIGGFVGSDALACLAYFGFDETDVPLAAIDLGTNGEVMVTDCKRILTASTAAGPAFEGVNIACGTRAIDGAVTRAEIDGGTVHLETIANEPPIGLTGSGLLSLVRAMQKADLIEDNGRFAKENPFFQERQGPDLHGARSFRLDEQGELLLSQWDVRELQKAKGAIRAAIDILMDRLHLSPGDLGRVILTGSFGGQVEIDAALGLGMLPPVIPSIVETIANGAGFGAASFLTEEGFARGEAIAARAEQIDLDADPDFDMRYVGSMSFSPDLN